MPWAPARSAAWAHWMAKRVGPPAPAMMGTLPRQVSTAVWMISGYSSPVSEKNSPVPPRGKEGGGAIRCQPFQALDVALPVEVTVGVEVGQRERQQAVGHDGFEFLGIHLGDPFGR